MADGRTVSGNESLPGDVRDCRLAEPHEVRRMKGYLEAAAAGADVDAGQRESALVDQRRQASSLAERADAANNVAGGSCSVSDGGESDASDAERVGGGLEVERVVDGYQGDGEPAAIGDYDERLEDRARCQTQRLGGFQPVGWSVLVMGVAENLEGDAGAFGGADGGSDGWMGEWVGRDWERLATWRRSGSAGLLPIRPNRSPQC